jgi:glycopeptide antibiotics resistance protein
MVFNIFAMMCLVALLATVLPQSVLQSLRKGLREGVKREGKVARFVRAILFLACLFSFVAMGVNFFVDLQLNTSFNQRLTVVAAFVPEGTVKSLKADWAKMKSRKDYLALNAKMEQLAAEQHVSLPQVLVE